LIQIDAPLDSPEKHKDKQSDMNKKNSTRASISTYQSEIWIWRREVCCSSSL